MFAPSNPPSSLLEESLSSVSAAVDELRASAVRAPYVERADAIAMLLRAADALTATAVELVGRGGLEPLTGMDPEMVVSIHGRRTFAEARTITKAAGVLHQMPRLSEAFAEGTVSWGQVRAITAAVSRVSVADRAEIDGLIGDCAPAMTDADPDRLVEYADELVARRREDLVTACEDRAIRGSFLSIQGRLDGRATIFGEADAQSAGTIVDALDALADAPVHPDEGLSRAEQHFAALVAMCEATLSGTSGGHARLRPRPRLLATFDVTGSGAGGEGMQLLWSLTGRSPRLSSVARETLTCDATVVPVVFEGSRPVQVGDASNTFSDKVRTAIAARDRRCRFCSRAPASWCDCHHIVDGKGNSADDGCLLCRVCHRRVHRYKWKIKMRPDGVIEFRRHGQFFLSLPP